MPGIGSGAIEAMIVSLRNNKNLLRRKSYFERENRSELNREEHHEGLNFPEASPELLHNIRQRHAERKKLLTILAFIVVLGAAIFSWYLIQINQPDAQVKMREIRARTASNESKKLIDRQVSYLSYIKLGDYWYGQGHFKNAAWQYETALWFYPNSEAALERLNMTHALACERQNMFCDELIKPQK